MEFICAKALDLFTKHEGYLRLSPDQLLEVLSFDSLNIPETELLGAVQLWGKTNKVYFYTNHNSNTDSLREYVCLSLPSRVTYPDTYSHYNDV